MFNVGNFGSNRDTMTAQSQSTVFLLEQLILRKWFHSEQTAKGLVFCYDERIMEFLSIYGNQFYQDPPKKRAFKTSKAQASQLIKENNQRLLKEKDLMEFNFLYR